MIDLEPDEASVLSWVAMYADRAAVFPCIYEVLEGCTHRSREIAEIMMGKSKSSNRRYVFTARRFMGAQKQQEKASAELYRYIVR